MNEVDYLLAEIASLAHKLNMRDVDVWTLRNALAKRQGTTTTNSPEWTLGGGNPREYAEAVYAEAKSHARAELVAEHQELPDPDTATGGHDWKLDNPELVPEWEDSGEPCWER